MLNDPYFVEGPAVISFSGGRTSAYMLAKILERGLQPDVHIMFANTGKERDETLDFVHAVERNFPARVHWLEYRRRFFPKYKSEERRAAAAAARAHPSASRFVATYLSPPAGSASELGFAEVDYATASRAGEPFDNLIEMAGLPNVTTRLCTQEMKVRVIKKKMMALGYDNWTNVVGIRADEPLRVARMRAPTGQRWENQLPLADAGVAEADVLAFWRAQPFDLQLGTYEGNCDLCFLKATDKKLRIARERPDLLAWWEAQEERTGMRFRDQRSSYAALRVLASTPTAAPAGAAPTCAVDDDLGDCICHD